MNNLNVYIEKLRNIYITRMLLEDSKTSLSKEYELNALSLNKIIFDLKKIMCNENINLILDIAKNKAKKVFNESKKSMKYKNILSIY